jgi:hypothetical protein
MGAITPIAWCDATFNPRVGCLRVSTACDRCYAAALSWRYGWRDGKGRDLWDTGADRKRTSSAYWRGPVRWNERAQAEGTRRRVFCASMADVFDNKAPTSWRVALWSLIRATPAFDWFLLTKRPQNIGDMLPTDWAAAGRTSGLAPRRKTKTKRIAAFRTLSRSRLRSGSLASSPWLSLSMSRHGWSGLLTTRGHQFLGSSLGANQAAALARCIRIGSEAFATRCMPPALSSSSIRSAAITRSGQVSPAKARTRHNGRPICGCRNFRHKVFPLLVGCLL